MVLVHDDDLERVGGIGEASVSGHLIINYILSFSYSQSLESLEPEVVMDLLRCSDIEIHKVCCGELLTSTLCFGSHGTSTQDLSSASSSSSGDISVVWVAMLSTSPKTWSRLCVVWMLEYLA